MLAISLPGFRVVNREMSAQGVCLGVRIDTKIYTCPVCSGISKSVHSSYIRRLRDLAILAACVNNSIPQKGFSFLVSKSIGMEKIFKPYQPSSSFCLQASASGALLLDTASA